MSGCLDRFRIIRLSDDQQKEFDHPELICVDPEGMPFIIADDFYEWLIGENCCSAKTANSYLNLVFHFFTFLWKCNPSLRYSAPAEQIRKKVREYLIEILSCQVRPHRNGNYIVKTSANSPKSARLFITALKRFYEFAILHKSYKQINPMVWIGNPYKEFIPKMPPISGLSLPEGRRGRVPDTYFCIIGGDWKPHIIDDPDIPSRLLPNFLNVRDFIIANILFQSGARISEVLDLTIGDWRSCNKGNRAKAKSKGSNGERVKEIWWDSETTELLRRYINNYRRDSQMRGLNELSDSDHIFVTDNGRPLSYIAFYLNWKRACKRAGLKITPHQVRHWYVTRALQLFAGHPADQQAEERQSLIAYIGWKSPNTIQAYDHHINTTDFGPAHAILAQLTKKRETKIEGVNISGSSLELDLLLKSDIDFVNQNLLGR